MTSYRVILDVPFCLVSFVSQLLAGDRHEIGARYGTSALTCWKQAKLQDRPDTHRPSVGFGIFQATAYRYKDEAVEVLVTMAPSLRGGPDKRAEEACPVSSLMGR